MGQAAALPGRSKLRHTGRKGLLQVPRVWGVGKRSWVLDHVSLQVSGSERRSSLGARMQCWEWYPPSRTVRYPKAAFLDLTSSTEPA